MTRFIHILLLVSLVLSFSCKEPRYPDALSTQEALNSFHLRDGFKIELVAAEPVVQDPVEMVFDENGNAFVVEMPDYPFMPENGKGTGRIKVLQDSDGDGRMDKATVFADSILEATSLLPWKGGLIVTAAPNILYLKDTDGDLRADSTEVLFSGFFENNSEAQITSLRFGVDNWIYAANNGQAGTVHFRREPDAPALNMSGSDFRFRLDRGQFELETGNAQFGLTMDDWGHRFITQNTLHIRQVIIPWRYLHRHGNMPTASPLLNISDHDLEMFQETPAPYWRAERTRRRQKQYAEEHLDRVEYAEDHFTGCSGGTVYDGGAFPSAYYGNVFTGDVSGNLIHRDVLTPQDTTPSLIAQRDEGEKTREFLSSTDSWFRPASFAVGPDGMLYVVDMYRQHIETPVSIPEDLKADMDFMNGSDKGRIYRIVPDGQLAARANAPRLREMASGALVKLLTHPNGWYRLQAQRLLLERHDPSVVPALKELFAADQNPRTRLHALYALEGLNALNPALVSKAMQDAHAGVRIHGLILAERYPELLPQVVSALGDSSIHVVLQATLSAGQFPGKEVIAGLARVIKRAGSDPWIQMAVLSSKAGSSIDVLQELVRLDFFQEDRPWKARFLEDLAFTVGKENQPQNISRLLAFLKQPAIAGNGQWQIAGARGLSTGLGKAEGVRPEVTELLKAMHMETGDEARTALADLSKYFSHI
ncbi:MAG TPA: PVC-type heme-binding CxxCH protein [Chryseosolibacter sp.]